jgi:hypothetical protein
MAKNDFYMVAVRYGTSENEYSDTTFIIGHANKVLEWIDKNGEAAILKTGLESKEAANKWQIQNWGTYNNFDFQKKILED